MTASGKAPRVVDVRRNSLDDGPGIRTVVFFKGCPLACSWCQNPECIASKQELQPLPDRCLGCGTCKTACEGDLDPIAGRLRASSCTSCGRCVEICPAGARRLAGDRVELEDLTSSLLRDLPFYRRSGGGVTLSGGEPLRHPEWVGALAARLAKADVHVLAETSGHFDFDRVARHVLPHLSAVYFDLKLHDPAAHSTHTGVDNVRILDNLQRLVARAGELGAELLVRVPLVPQITTRTNNLRGIAATLVRLGLGRVALLAYNPLWLDKRRALDMGLPYAHADWMADGAISDCRKVFEDAGVNVLV